jgi:hypothetical protein
MITYKAIVCQPSLWPATVELPYGADPTIPSPIAFGQHLRSMVGGWIEAVCLTPKITMYINEEGKLHELAYNHAATVIAHQYCLPLSDYIAGTAVILGGPDEHGNDTPLAPDMHMEIMDYIDRLYYRTQTRASRLADQWTLQQAVNMIVRGNG